MELNKGKLSRVTRGYTFKALFLAGLVLVLLLPFSMIGGVVRDRKGTASDAEAGIMEAWGRQLVAAGPVMVVPGVRTAEVVTKTERDGERVDVVKTAFDLVVAPRTLSIDASFTTEIRRRGIFSVPLYSGALKLSGTFDPDMALSSLGAGEVVAMEQAELVISLSSQKGIRKIERALWGDGELFFQPGNRGYGLVSASPRSGAGIHAGVPGFARGAVR
jgi:inner membrane protein